MNPVIDKYGHKRWHNKKGELHRLMNPAEELINGSKVWYINGEVHRLDGPALTYASGKQYWYWLGVECTEQQHSILSNIRFFTRKVKI